MEVDEEANEGSSPPQPVTGLSNPLRLHGPRDRGLPEADLRRHGSYHDHHVPYAVSLRSDPLDQRCPLQGIADALSESAHRRVQLPASSVARAILKHIHSLREKQYGYGQTLEEYQAKYFTTRATKPSTTTGTHKEILIRESQIRVQGSLTSQPVLVAKKGKKETDGR